METKLTKTFKITTYNELTPCTVEAKYFQVIEHVLIFYGPSHDPVAAFNDWTNVVEKHQHGTISTETPAD